MDPNEESPELTARPRTAGPQAEVLPDYTRCAAVLQQERELVAKIAGYQDLVRKTVISRQWMDFETCMDSLGQIGEEFQRLDQERIRIFAAFAGGSGVPEDVRSDSTGFYALVSRFPDEERKAVTEIYRNLKMETMRVRLENDALMTYLNEARLLVAGFLDAAFPDRKGRI
jgi:hypothetical protein